MNRKELKTNEDFINYWKEHNKGGYQRIIGNRDLLHENSKELVEICKNFNVLKDGTNVFEIGCGCGRNLYYIWKSNPDIKISGNDLIREECFRYMEEDIKEIIDFRENDTLSIVNGLDISSDILLSSDHLMHLEPSVSKKVLKLIVNKWKPKYILLRESIVDRLKKGSKKFKVDYSIVKEKYKILYENPSRGDDSYMIVLGERVDD